MISSKEKTGVLIPLSCDAVEMNCHLGLMQFDSVEDSPLRSHLLGTDCWITECLYFS
jgi:hypothetical protein